MQRVEILDYMLVNKVLKLVAQIITQREGIYNFCSWQPIYLHRLLQQRVQPTNKTIHLNLDYHSGDPTNHWRSGVKIHFEAMLLEFVRSLLRYSIGFLHSINWSLETVPRSPCGGRRRCHRGGDPRFARARPGQELHNLRRKGLADIHERSRRGVHLGNYPQMKHLNSSQHQIKSAVRPR